MVVVEEENDTPLYAVPDDPILILHRRATLRRLIVGELILLVIVCLFEAFPILYYRTAAWAPLPNQVAYYALVSLWIPLGMYAGISRYWSTVTRPKVTKKALILSKGRAFSLGAIEEIRISDDGKLLTLEMDPDVLKRPRIIVVSLGGPLVPDSDHFLEVLKHAWSIARDRGDVQ